jgi:hypothetical protein
MDLALGIETAQRIEDFRVDGFNCLLDALTEVTLAAIAQFYSFMRASGCAPDGTAARPKEPSSR